MWACRRVDLRGNFVPAYFAFIQEEQSMKKAPIFKRVAALSLAALMALSLSACRDLSGGLTTKDASDCVQVELDTTYKGKFDGFVDFYSNVTTSDAKKQYDGFIEYEAAGFLNGLGALGVPSLEDEDTPVEPSEMQLHRAKELYKKIYAKSDYSIVSSSKQDDGTFAVKVAIKPLDILTLLANNYDAGFEAFDKKFDPIWDTYNAANNDGTLDYEEFANWYNKVYASEYYDTLLDLLEAQIPDIGYKAEKSIVIQVQQSEDSSLFISDEDWQNLDNLIIDYSGE